MNLEQTPVLDAHAAAVVIEENLAQRVLRQLEAMHRRGTPDAVHDCRVELMRLRSVVSSLPEAMAERTARHLDAELKWLRRALATVREYDVVLAALTRLARKGAPHPDYAPLRAHCRKQRELALVAARHKLASKRAARLIARLQKMAQRNAASRHAPAPLRSSADAALSRALDRVLRRGHHRPQLDADGLHRLRIALKRLRYTAEPLRGLYAPPAFDTYCDTLQPLLQRLGGMQDAVLLVAAATAIEHDHRAPAEHAVSRLRRYGERLLRHHRHRLGRDWKRFKQQAPFWDDTR